ncbi:GNAT family N-acetyltransferase [Aeoliella mucimassa]|nr:GNAT family N-acetyltransferase [Aeoliella mucimassa]
MSKVLIRPCPADLHRDALRMVLGSVDPEQRGSIIELLRPLASEGFDVFAGLVIAEQASELLGSIWLQPQVGRTATLWPAAVAEHAPAGVSQRLAEAALQQAAVLPVSLVQTLLHRSDEPFTKVLESVGFSHLADLCYLLLTVPPRCEPVVEPALEFVPSSSDPALLEQLTTATYRETLDCPDLEGRRNIADVMDGYRTIGVHDPNLWSIVHWHGQPVGVLLMAPYPEANQWELVYMGVIPEARGQAIGGKILAELKCRASRAGVDHIVLAADAANHPALAMYSQAGYTEWTRRVAYVKSVDGL